MKRKRTKFTLIKDYIFLFIGVNAVVVAIIGQTNGVIFVLLGGLFLSAISIINLIKHYRDPKRKE